MTKKRLFLSLLLGIFNSPFMGYASFDSNNTPELEQPPLRYNGLAEEYKVDQNGHIRMTSNPYAHAAPHFPNCVGVLRWLQDALNFPLNTPAGQRALRFKK